ncbi:hypothetical protein [Peribacillus muralis]|uniref:hypothetical protein n=1 Tax=Peribacillus muralis TaxID=264697 RepID=UPI00366FDB66
MKKSFVMIVLMALIASGCITRNFDSNMDLGKDQLHEENYLEAHEAFELAYKEAQTTKVKELRDISGFLANGMKKYDEQDFKSAQVEFKLASSYKAKSVEGKQLVLKGKDMISLLRSTSIELSEGSDLEGSSAEPTTDSQGRNEPQAQDKTAEPEEDKEESEVNTLSKLQAEKLVRDYVDMENFSHLQIKYTHKDNKGDFIFQVFESDQGSKGSGHRATWGWYGVNTETKEVYEVMKEK